MDYPSFSQLALILKNDADFKLSKLVEIEYFIIAFVEHLKEHFNRANKQFSILIPLLDPSFEEEQHTIISLDGTELGELCLINNSVTDNSSLVYSSASGLLKTNICDLSAYAELDVSEYLLMLNEFASIIIGEHILYKDVKKH